MTLADLVQVTNEAVRASARGQRPFIVLEVPGKKTGRKAQIEFGTVRLNGRVLGWKNADKPDVATAVRFFCDDVHRELIRAGVASRDRPAPPAPPVAAEDIVRDDLLQREAAQVDAAGADFSALEKKLGALNQVAADLAADAPARPEDIVRPATYRDADGNEIPAFPAPGGSAP